MNQENIEIQHTGTIEVPEVVEPKKRGRKPKNKRYLTDEELMEELEKCHASGVLSDKLVQMYTKIVHNLQTQFMYLDEQDKEDCYYGAIEVFINKWKHFDMERKRPFSYYTRMAYNGLYATWNNLKQNNRLQDNVLVSYSHIFTEEI